MHRGYFAVWRKIQDHPFYKEKRAFSKLEAWIDLLLEAQYQAEPKTIILKMTKLTQNYGECLRSIGGWSRRWGWGKSRVSRFFKLLEKMNQIRYGNEKITTRITILNYAEYDPRRNGSDTRARRHRDGIETASSTTKEGKEGKEYKEVQNRATPGPFLNLDIDEKILFLICEKIFPRAAAFINTQRRAKKNEGAINHALIQCYRKAMKNGNQTFDAWAYCQKVINDESGNYNEQDSINEAQRQKRALRELTEGGEL